MIQYILLRLTNIRCKGVIMKSSLLIFILLFSILLSSCQKINYSNDNINSNSKYDDIHQLDTQVEETVTHIEDNNKNEEITNKNTIDVWDGTVATKISKGSGTEDDPYIISTASELAFMAEQINENGDKKYSNNNYYNKYYKLANSIDLNGLEWNPIGCAYANENTLSSNRKFRGFFDGNQCTISNFKITVPEKEYYAYFGLFGYVVGTITGLSVTNYDINIKNKDFIYVGGICGFLDCGYINNSFSQGKISANSRWVYAGGILGKSLSSSINNCYSSGIIETFNDDFSNTGTQSGGIVGCVKNNESIIENCYSTTNIYVNCRASYPDVYIGGILGMGTSENVNNCYRYKEQIIQRNQIYKMTNDFGLQCSLDELNSADFYISTLMWNPEIWDFSKLDYLNSKMPIFKTST